MSFPCLCIAGTHSGCGKTTVSLGIMAAFVMRGLTVQPFKVGPDFIDPGHHRRITGRDSHNLDGWMMSRKTNHDIFEHYRRDADVAVIEGVMGLFDGFSGKEETGSTAQMAKWLGLPTVLVIDARSMARSAAAVALGFATFDPALSLKGVIFNRVGSGAHREIIEEAMMAFPHIPVLGYLPKEEGLEIPSRHLGLVTDEDFRADEDRIQGLGQWIEANLDLDSIIQDSGIKAKDPIDSDPDPQTDIKIGIARDEAFCFYYPENIRRIKKVGAEPVLFSPLRSAHLPEGISGLIFGGGYPELHCKTLSQNKSLLAEIREFGLRGGPVYGECGGFMYLMNEICDFDGKCFPMVGIFSMTAKMEKNLRSLGYREIETQEECLLGPPGTKIKGHEFHYSSIKEPDKRSKRIYKMKDRKGTSKQEEGFLLERILGSYVHLHWGSNAKVAGNFVDYCRRFQNET